MPLHSSNRFPILFTKRLVLRQPEESDAAAILQLRSDEKVNTWLDRPVTTSFEDALAFIQKVKKGIAAGDSLYWIISQQSSSILIGTICLWNYVPAKKLAETGYELLPQYQGKGLMQEALQAVLHYSFSNLGLQVITAVSRKENARSILLLQKLNFKPGDNHEYGDPDISNEQQLYYLKNQDYF